MVVADCLVTECKRALDCIGSMILVSTLLQQYARRLKAIYDPPIAYWRQTLSERGVVQASHDRNGKQVGAQVASIPLAGAQHNQ